MRRILMVAMSLDAAAACGCGKPSLYPVTGEVKIGGNPGGGVRVFFWSDSRGDSPPSTRIGMGFTDPNGRFSVNCGGGEEGLERGNYHVTFSRPVSKGKTMVAGERPSNAVESVPAPYNDHENPQNSPVTASVPASAGLVFEIPVNR